MGSLSVMPREGDDERSTVSSEARNESSWGPRPLSLRSWRTNQSQASSRAASPDTALSRWVTRFYDDYGAYLHQGDFEPEQDKKHFDRDIDMEREGREEKEAKEEEAEEQPRGGAEDYESDVEARKSQDDRAGENAGLKKAGSIPPLSQRQTAKSTRSQRPKDPNMVSWEGPNDPENPKNWAAKRKWAAVLVVSSFTFITPVSSSMVAPALPTLKQDLNITGDVLVQMILSIFVLAYAIGPLILGPLSEVYGRVPVLQLTNLFFLVFNLVCGFAQNSTQMLVFRFLAGLGGSAPLAIGGGVLADLFPPEQRGQAIAVYSLAPLIGPAAGPVAGGFIAGNVTWRWVFWSVSIADAVIQISGIFFLQETWAPKLLEQKAKKLRKGTGNDQIYPATTTNETLLHKLEKSLVRPFRFLFTQPIVICAALYMAYLYGQVYLVISSFSALYTSANYGQSVQIAGLHYIALAIGCFIGSQFTARFNDLIHRRQKAKNNGKGSPEFRVPVLIPCAILLPIGFFWYGWSAQKGVFWIMPDIGALILGAATIAGYQGMQSYIIDCYTTYAASAVAAISTLQFLAGFGFPLFAPLLYQSLGYGWGNSLLAFVAIAIGIPAPWFFWHFGARLRAKSQFGAG